MEYAEILVKILVIIGWGGIFWMLFDLMRAATKYLNQKTYEMTHKKVCDTCFQLLKEMVDHSRGV